MCSTLVRLPRARRSIGGFTLIEILIVVVILGILAALLIPQFSNASQLSRQNVMKEDLRYLRTQVAAFRYQHRDVPPGYPGGNTAAAPTEADFVDQLTRFTDDRAATSVTPSPSYPYGPYLSRLPMNPLTGYAGLWVVTGPTMPAPDQARPFAWIYNPQLLKLAANVEGVDAEGASYASY